MGRQVARGVAATRLLGVRLSLRALGWVARRGNDIVAIPRRCGTVGPLRVAQAPNAVMGIGAENGESSDVAMTVAYILAALSVLVWVAAFVGEGRTRRGRGD